MTDITVSTANGGTDLNVDVTKGTDLVLDVSIGNQITLAIDKGYVGASGFSGYSGYSGMSGSVYIGTSPPSTYGAGSMWWDDVAGKLKIYYVDQNGGQWVDSITGTAGASGYSGFSGQNGTIGVSGASGFSGFSGSGLSGYSGSGLSGFSGYSGLGVSGFSGFSGQSGASTSGFSGYSGASGFSGSGISGYSGAGTSGFSGYSGAGLSGFSGYSGSGISGYSGANGASGISGFSGSGISGYSGFSGLGLSGFSGSGISGFSGYSGYSGIQGQSSNLFLYMSNTSATSGYPGDGDLLWNNATQISATQINVSHLTDDSTDIEIFLALLQSGQNFVIQDQNVSENYQTWRINGNPTQTNWGTSTAYLAIPVTLVNSAGTGTSGFANAHPLFLAIVNGVSGYSGYSGSGTSGYSGYSGLGLSGFSGFSGTGVSGFSGYSGSGISGFSGSGISGYSGIGISGFSGFSGSGISGYSGSGISGYSGYSGSGISGFSGSGISGWSGYSGQGLSGFSGYSGTNGTGTSGISGYSGSGISGFSGYSGSGISGYSGSGISGYSGSGISGFSGYSGSGLSGYSGSGVSGYSGYSGTAFTGGTLTSPLVTSVSTTTNGTEPIKFQTGVVTTSPAAGTMEYDGTTLFSTPQATNRGVIPSVHYINQVGNYTTPAGTANTLKQMFNGSTAGSMTAAGNTSYFFECFFSLTTMSATSGNFQFGLGGTATVTNILYIAQANKSASTTQTTISTTVGTVKTALSLTGNNTTTTGYAFIKGKIVVSTGGTIIPSFALSVANAAVVLAGSYFQIWEAGTNTEVEIGNWA